MHKCLKKAVIAAFCMLTAVVGHAQVSVTDNSTAQALAARLTGPGVVVLNPVLTCPLQANGIFQAGSSNLGLDSGIVLTTGRSAGSSSFIGVNGGAFNHASTRNNASGDPQLDPLAGQPTHDACALEFDVIPQGDTMKFDYVFGSEEYINATCGPYNDAFAFFISGPGITGVQNMALVPGTSIPVTINSINNGIPGPNYNISGCTIMGLGSPFTGYYVDNSSGATITYQGFTKVLQAYHAVTPCSTYHLKMVIADGGNYLYDSGVFIKAGSLKANTFSVKAESPGTSQQDYPFAVKNCAPGRFRIQRTQVKGTPQTVKFFIAGTAVNGVDYAAIADSVVILANQPDALVTIRGLATPVAGPKTVKLLVRSPNNCSGALIADSATLVLYDTISVKMITPDTAVCKGEAVILNVAADTQLTFRWLSGGQIENTGKQMTTARPVQSGIYVVSASWPSMGCAAKTDTVQIRVKPVPELAPVPGQRVCLHQPAELGIGVYPPYAHYSYLWTGPAGVTAVTDTLLIPDVTRQHVGIYTVVVGLDTSNCTAAATVKLEVGETMPPATAPIIFCQGKPAMPLSANGKQLRWYGAATGGTGTDEAPVPVTDNTGFQAYFVTQTLNGCESERVAVPVEVKVCCDKPVFLPNAFTPNNDGHNDRFSPGFAGYGFTLKRMRIFNRWGQLLYESFDTTGSWDGSGNGGEAPAGTYFYEVLATCKGGGDQHFKGDVILIR